ncbi:MAG: HAD family hydrolase [Oscillospiraceae bacterium]|nr:HAD family hydrolase [Oscillospiraceae bacterium]
MPAAVIFDLDGTLWDATGRTYKIWNGVFARRSETRAVCLSRRDLKGFMGMTLEAISETLFPDLPASLRAEIMDECSSEENVCLARLGGRLFDGLKTTLEYLKRERELFIVSNCQTGYIEAFLQAHGLHELFRDTEMSGRTGRPKGENVVLLMERNGVDSAVYVGDTALDEQAARYAGIPFVFAAYGFGRAESPDAVINKISELPSVLAGLGC